jgi:hypothetical protein
VSLLPGILVKNWQLKLSALAMAVLLWTVPRFEGQSTRVLPDVPVIVQLNDPEWAPLGDPSPAEVSVTVSGPARELFAIGVDRPPVIIPVDEVTSQDTTVMLRPLWFRGAGRDEVVVEGLTPDAVTLSFEAIEQRDLFLSVPLSGELPPGISLAEPPGIQPDRARVLGPTSRFEGLDSLRLLSLDLALLDEPGPYLLSVDTAGLEGLTVHPLQVSVEVQTEPTTAREFPDLTLRLPRLSADPQLQARPASVTVVLVGARSLVENVDPEALTVTVPTARANLAPGQEVQEMVVVEGVPDLVEARVTPDWVFLRRPVGQ